MPITKSDKLSWIARLEDPASKKARGVLHDPETGGMCCLGHLADVKGLWDGEGKRTVLGVGTMPGGPLCGLTSDEMEGLAILNDTQDGFPLDAIRALPEIDDDASGGDA